MKKITTKRDNTELLTKGYFGNYPGIWYSVKDVLANCQNETVVIRNFRAESLFQRYNVPLKAVQELINSWMNEPGFRLDNIYFNEDIKSDHIILNAEIVELGEGMYLTYSTMHEKMRTALKLDSHFLFSDLQIRLFLRGIMDISSYNDLFYLLDNYPEHTIEFSCWEHQVGIIPGRNTIIWEVRKY